MRQELMMTNGQFLASPVDVSEEAFRVPRTPRDLAEYQARAFAYLAEDRDRRHAARMRKGPFKTFIEELTPFSLYCSWKYGEREDVTCRLAPKNDAGDGLIDLPSQGKVHNVEICWPIDGQKDIQVRKALNKDGKHFEVGPAGNWEVAADFDRIREAAKKKAMRNYSVDGVSTLLFVYDEWPHFWSNNSDHLEMLAELVDELRGMRFQVDEVALLIVPSGRMVPVRLLEEVLPPGPEGQF